jgi:nitrogen fixation protein NifU and related proteins
MADVRELYQEVILDHNKKPRNYFKIENYDRSAEGNNPLCGDRLSVYLKMDGEKIADASFQGNGCAISKASASLMTTMIKGKGVSEVDGLIENFLKLVTGNSTDAGKEALGKLIVFSGVSEFPVRVKCASLAWRTLQAALNDKNSNPIISTE